jgi:hypothetical protein
MHKTKPNTIARLLFSIYKDQPFKGHMKLELSIHGEEIAKILKVTSTKPASEVLYFHCIFLHWDW